MNIFDVIVLLILGLCMFYGYRRGLIAAVFKLLSFFVSIALTNQLYPIVSKWLRSTALYDRIKASVIQSMGLQSAFQEHTTQTANDLIDSLHLPDLLRDSLSAFNTPDMYDLLGVKTLKDYIAGYFANIAINTISMVTVFLLVWVIMGVISKSLNIIGRLPLISTFNHVGGLAAGLLMGILVVWIGLTLMNLLFVSPSHPEWVEPLQSSWAARWFYEHNWLFPMTDIHH